MSLKAKLEAVIYAAEEPVTLAQLASIFGYEALEWKAAEEAAAAAKDGDKPAAEPATAVNQEFVYTEPESAPTGSPVAAEEPAPAVAEAEPEPAAEASSDAAAEESHDNPATPDSPTVEPDAAAAEAEAKRLARQRDRDARAVIRKLLDELIESYVADGRGVEIREIAGGYRMATKPECHDAVRMFVKSLKPALKLSLPALETLAVIAYKQPVTAPEVNEIRGVDSSGVFGSLLARKLIATAGRKQVIGRPILYKTTREFLLRFGLKDVAELPSMEEFEKMAASEFDEPEPSAATETAAEVDAPASADFDEAAREDSEDSTQDEAAPAIATPADEVAPNHTEAAPVASSTADEAETEISPHEQ
jgi:segregation and condensation protein B